MWLSLQAIQRMVLSRADPARLLLHLFCVGDSNGVADALAFSLALTPNRGLSLSISFLFSRAFVALIKKVMVVPI